MPDVKRLLSAGHEACQVLTEAGVPHMVGGGLAIWAYGRRRATKDIDLFIPAKIPYMALDALGKRGFFTRDSDAGWLYKAFKQEILIDLIVWTTGNIRLDDETFARVRRVEIDGYPFGIMGPEDMLFRKILSHREERRDWYDGLSMLGNLSGEFDWDYFMRRVGPPHARRVLSFLLYAQSELSMEVVPESVIGDLLTAVSLGL
ncbi:MAG TPA: nucleotidyltransferase [Stenomitos sp.]